MPGYMHPCRYCNNLVPPDSNVCPVCGKHNPSGPLRCPRCRSPIRKSWIACSYCGLELKVKCPQCGKETFFGDHCEHCEARLVMVCSKCGSVQPPLGPKCVKCGSPLVKIGQAQ